MKMIMQRIVVVLTFSAAALCAQEGDAQTRALISLLPQPNAQQVALFEQGADVWNRYRQENPDVAINLFGITEVFNFPVNPEKFDADTGMGIDFKGINLANANLRRVIFGFSNFSSGVFKAADWTAAFLVQSAFTGADCTAAVMLNAQLSLADFTDAQLVRVLIRNALCVNALFVRANFEGSNCTAITFSGVRADSALFISCRFDTSVMVDSILTNVTFLNSIGTHMVIARTNFTGSDFSSTTFTQSVFTQSLFNNTRFAGANLSGSQFLDGCIFDDSSLFNVNLTKTSFTSLNGGASMRNVDFSGADVAGATMGAVDFSGANLSSVRNLEQAYLVEALYTTSTRFPSGFDPVVAGMILVQ